MRKRDVYCQNAGVGTDQAGDIAFDECAMAVVSAISAEMILGASESNESFILVGTISLEPVSPM